MRILLLMFLNLLCLKTLSCSNTIDKYLQEKIILCTGPALHRGDMLKQTLNTDSQFIKYKKIFITTNDPSIANLKFDSKIPIQLFLIPEREKQIDCINCILSTLKNAAQDSSVFDDDIILFKHESVFINDIHLFKNSIEQIIKGFDLVIRRPDWEPMVMATDAFFVKVKSIRNFIFNLNEISEIPNSVWHKYMYCELFIHENIERKMKRIFAVHYLHENGGDTELGFYHYSNPLILINWYWDKKNYDSLFK